MIKSHAYGVNVVLGKGATGMVFPYFSKTSNGKVARKMFPHEQWYKTELNIFHYCKSFRGDALRLSL